MAKVKVNKYRVIDENHKNFGKKIKAVPNGLLQYVDVKTGETYDIKQVAVIPDAHAVYGGIRGNHFGVFLFAREYWQYRSFQFGISFDAIGAKGGDKYFDIELRIACFGVGIRFVSLNNEKK